MIKISQACDEVPSPLFVRGVTLLQREAAFGGGFADVYKASYRGQIVALKRLRVFQNQPNYGITRKVNETIISIVYFSDCVSACQGLCREALMWGGLSHPHVLPFLGADSVTFPSSLPCLVSPWMWHGTIVEYLKTTRPKLKNEAVNKLVCHFHVIIVLWKLKY